MADAKYLAVFVTVADAEFGKVMGRSLVEEGLAACVQVIPGGTSIYRWQGELMIEPAAQLIVKTKAASWQHLRERILALHSDEVPEVLALPIVDGLPAYLRWMDEVTPSASTVTGPDRAPSAKS